MTKSARNNSVFFTAATFEFIASHRLEIGEIIYISTCLEDRLFEVVLRNFNLAMSENSPNFPGLAEYNNAILCKL